MKVLCVPEIGDRLFFSVFVRFIDIGKEEEVKSHQILQLPEEFHSLPDQAVEIIVCRVKPVDAEIDWHPKVSSSHPHFAFLYSNFSLHFERSLEGAHPTKLLLTPGIAAA